MTSPVVHPGARAATPRPDRPVLSRTEEVDPASVRPGLLDAIAATPSAAWVTGPADDRSGLVGWGRLTGSSGRGGDQFAEVQRWWAETAPPAPDGVPPGVGPVLFTSFPFDPLSRTGAVTLVPRVVVVRRDGRVWLSVLGTDGTEVDAGLRDALDRLSERAEAPAGATDPLPTGSPTTVGGRARDAWAAAVSEAVRRIDGGPLQKVVLARDVVLETGTEVDVRALVERLATRHPGCWGFALDGFVGATPELLVSRTGTAVRSRVLAGTAVVPSPAADDPALAAGLLGSAKDLREHRFAVDSVARALTAHCRELDVPVSPSVLRLATVDHLASDVTGVLADGASVLELASDLHPTAAVCGTPRELAMDTIRELEGIDRGRYAGPVGWVDAHGDGELGVALRCAVVDGTRLRLLAGCGIVSGSEPGLELAESDAKLRAVLDALG